MQFRITFVLCSLFTVQGSFVYPCRTPNNESGYCISLFSCPSLMKALGTLEATAIKFVEQSVCYGCVNNNLMVCCGPTSSYTTTQTYFTEEHVINQTTNCTQNQTILTIESTTESITNMEFNSNKTYDQLTIGNPPEKIDLGNVITETRHEHVKRKLLPSRKFCGLQHTDDRFYAENDTALDEFPWLVHVIFIPDDEDDPSQYLDRCNGVLISNKYVLTTEYCGTYPTAVRLGQHFTNKTVTCVENPTFSECSEPRIDVDVEKEIHRINDTKKWHDFTLLRLAKRVEFSDFIRPICLNFDDPNIPKVQHSLIFSGWGATDGGDVNKKRLQYRIINETEECYKLDDKELKSATTEAVCLKPQQPGGELACTGDEGGPLLYSHRHQWFAEALITRVYSEPTDEELCSNQLPIAGIKINADVLNWILNNIED